MANHSQFGFQDASSPIMEELVEFHDHALMLALAICSLVLYLLALMLMEKLSSNTVDAQEIELISTILPAIVLIMLALPSLQILYMKMKSTNQISHSTPSATNDTEPTSTQTLKTSHSTPTSFQQQIFHQDTSDYSKLTIACHPNTISHPHHRHSQRCPPCLSSPRTGCKNSCNPTALNQTSFITTRPGVFYGQCSEICGANHSYMPIVVESTPLIHFEHSSSLMSS
uniref:Cytochrome c oxidase subunit 2 n=1 Tax=Aquila audax TaxID=8961 RepID=A0A3G5FPU6_AQUAU